MMTLRDWYDVRKWPTWWNWLSPMTDNPPAAGYGVSAAPRLATSGPNLTAQGSVSSRNHCREIDELVEDYHL